MMTKEMYMNNANITTTSFNQLQRFTSEEPLCNYDAFMAVDYVSTFTSHLLIKTLLAVRISSFTVRNEEREQARSPRFFIYN